MPGLLRGMARTAVAAGTWTAVSNRVSRRQANRWAAQDQQQYEQQYAQQQYAQQQYYQAPAAAPAPAAPADPGRDRIAQLKDLASLKESGVLTEAEFETEKARILG